MGRHSRWDEVDHPRGDDGKFASGAGGGGASDAKTGGHSGASSSGRGMPDAISGADIPVRDGKELALDYHPDGGMTVSDGEATLRLPSAAASDLMHGMDRARFDEPGRERWVNSVDRDANGLPGQPKHAALIRKEDDDTITLRLAPQDNVSVQDLRNAPAVRLDGKDIDNLEKAEWRRDSASRVDTGNGDADVYITDDNQFAIRHLGDDGRPVETMLSPKSFAEINHAINVVIDGWDDRDPSLADDDIVTQRTVTTNAGDVTVELQGEWDGSSPGDRLLVAAEDGSWGIVVDGPSHSAFADALSRVSDAGEALDFYDPHTY